MTANIKSDVGLLLDEIYELIDIPNALAELEPKDRGKYYELKCPNCDKRKAFIYKGSHTIKCNRANECNYSSSLWDYVSAKNGSTSSRETLQALADLAGYTLPSTLNPEALERVKQAQDRQSKLEIGQAYLEAQLFSDSGKKELDYLHGRGYSDDDIKAMGLGKIPALSALDAYTADNVNNVNTKIAELHTAGYGTTHTLSIPFRDSKGRLIGWSVRSISGAERKYKYSQGLDSGILFNLYANREESELVIVESPIDALLATARDLKGVVALNRNRLGDNQIAELESAGIKAVTLALDNDDAGRQGTEEALEKLAKAGIRTYVLQYPDGVKDLDELLNKKDGKKLYEKAYSNREAGVKYLIKCLQCKLCKHDIKNLTDAEKRDLLDALIELDYKYRRDDLATNDIMDYITETLGISPEQVKDSLEKNRETLDRQKRERDLKAISFRANKLISDGDYDGAQKLYEEELPKLKPRETKTIIAPYTTDDLLADLRESGDGFSTGYKSLDEYVTIPTEAITIIAGRPSHGKTTMMLNLLYNLIEQYPDKSFYFFSYEETKAKLAVKFITLIAGVQIDQYKNTKKIEQYIKTRRVVDWYATGGNERAKKAIDEAMDKYNELVSSGRLRIIDEPLEITNLASTIDSLKGKAGAVFIDYIQKIRIKGKYQSRQVEIQKISGEILDASKRAGVASILGAQLNRQAGEKTDAKGISLEQLRESGDIEQDANLVLGLYNEDRANYDKDPTTSREQGSKPETILTVKILKNRDGITNESVDLTLQSPILKIKEGE